MPVVQKLKNLVHRNSEKSIPEAPVAPAPVVAAPVAPVVVEPLNGQTLLTQKDHLARAELNNGNVYNNLAAEETLLRENRLDRNGDGIIDSRDNLVAGNRLSQGFVADRNGDGIIDARDGLVGNRLSQNYEGAYIQSAQRASLVRAEPTIVETIQKEVVIQERIHPVEKEEIQPIIYREREQLDVKQVTQMMHETAIEPTLIEQRELAAEYREAIVERAAPIEQNIVLPSTEIDAVQRTQVVHAPIVEEIVKKTVIQEIQPVLERDVFQPVVIQNTQAIHEKIIEAPTVYREVREVRELGTRSVGMDTAYVQESMLAQENMLRQENMLAQENMLNNGAMLNSGYQTETLLTHRGLSSSAYEDQRLSQQMLAQQNLSQGSYELNQQRLSQNGLANGNMLATGQVLPAVQSSRPAYAYLPANYQEQRPVFVGTASEYVRAASGLNQNTLAHAKTLPTVYPMNMTPQQVAPMSMQRQ